MSHDSSGGSGRASSPLLTLLSAPALTVYHQQGHWGDATIYAAVQRSTAVDPNRVAIRESVRCVTYSELLAEADRMAAELATAGLVAGDRVAVWTPSRVEVAVALLACSRNGYVCCPSLHRDHTVEEVIGLLDRMSAAACLVERGYGADAEAVDIAARWADVASLRSAHVLNPAASSEFGSGAPKGLPPIDTDPDSVVYLAFTSGTTGAPKGVMHSDNTLLAPIRAMIADWSFDRRSVVYTLSPLSHNLGFGAMVLALTVGAELVVNDLPRGSSVLDRVTATGATFLFGVPTHAVDLLAELDLRPPPPLQVRGFRISGASVSPTVAARLIDKGIAPQSGYGMTEGGSHHYTRPDDDLELVVGTSGRPFAGHDARIFSADDADCQVKTGETGQIGARGPSMMLGYFGDQALTADSYNRDGFFLSGDLGWVDEDGYIRITGRKKDIIIRGGHNIYPAKIEALAAKHPRIEQAVLVPMLDERLGERACLVVRPAASSEALEVEELLNYFAAAGLSKFDMPEYYLEVDAMPLTASGKILKRRLTDDIASGARVPRSVRYRRSAAPPGSQQ